MNTNNPIYAGAALALSDRNDVVSPPICTSATIVLVKPDDT